MASRQTDETPADCKQCEHWDKVKRREELHEVVQHVADNIKIKVKDEHFTPSLTDYFRAVDALTALEQYDPQRPIMAGWVDSLGTSAD
jgi:hypothetical protein